MLSGFVHKELADDLLKECVKMSMFDHPNVLNLIGVCLDGGPAPYIIMPFMENGSLLSYLRKKKDVLVSEPVAGIQDVVSATSWVTNNSECQKMKIMSQGTLCCKPGQLQGS